MNNRKGYVLTLNPTSERALFSKKVLEKIGFDVIFVEAIPNADKVLSNKISMQYIYSLIRDSNDDYAYVFEDDINKLADITLDEIIEYEKISEMFFYLGCCEYKNNAIKTDIKIRGHDVYTKSDGVRGLHAIGLSKKGCKRLLNRSNKSNELYMDIILENFARRFPANVCRYDLRSYISGHKGVLFQDRKKFPSSI